MSTGLPRPGRAWLGHVHGRKPVCPVRPRAGDRNFHVDVTRCAGPKPRRRGAWPGGSFGSLIRTFKFKSHLCRAFSKLLFSVPALPPDARGPASGSRRPSRCSSPAPFPVTSAARAPEPLPRLVLRRRPTGPIPLCAQVLLQVPAGRIGFPGGRGQRPFSLCSFAAPRGARCRLPHSASVCLSGRLRVSGLGPRPLAALRSAVSSVPGAVFAA